MKYSDEIEEKINSWVETQVECLKNTKPKTSIQLFMKYAIRVAVLFIKNNMEKSNCMTAEELKNSIYKFESDAKYCPGISATVDNFKSFMEG